MDLVDVLTGAAARTDHTADRLGHAALDAYYDDVFATHLSGRPGRHLVRASLNFGVQQLATRSRVDRERERFLQIGSLHEADFAAALIQAMPQTRTAWVPGLTAITPEQTRKPLAALRAALPDDALPHDIAITGEDWRVLVPKLPQCSCGLIAVCAGKDGPGALPKLLAPLLNPRGRIVLFHEPRSQDTASPEGALFHHVFPGHADRPALAVSVVGRAAPTGAA